ncbi:hypothetical protein NIES4073_03110 (plasmid) [Kalymmatonema gypsitolerans NIES-4073]|nr:hypothetical protein NIES4073_03110 [Scytonema sp. NIES-4073]
MNQYYCAERSARGDRTSDNIAFEKLLMFFEEMCQFRGLETLCV